MKLRILFLILTWLFVSQPCLSATKTSCEESPLTQYEMNECYLNRLKEVENKLSKVFQNIISKSDDPIFIDKFKAAQKAWEVYRDAELAAIYPHGNDEDKPFYYGSVYPMCYYITRTELTAERLKELTQWVEGVSEDEACYGSFPVKQSKKKRNIKKNIKKPRQ